MQCCCALSFSLWQVAGQLPNRDQRWLGSPKRQLRATAAATPQVAGHGSMDEPVQRPMASAASSSAFSFSLVSSVRSFFSISSCTVGGEVEQRVSAGSSGVHSGHG